MNLARSSPVHLPRLRYLGGEALTPSGASAAATIPRDATIFLIKAEDQDCHYAFNAPAGAASPGYVATGEGEQIGPVARGPSADAVSTLNVFSVAGGIVHIQYFAEV